MAPALSLMATFRFILAAGYTWTAVPSALLLAGVLIIITAISFAYLSKATPEGGSVWIYSKNALGPMFGQFTVWIYLLQLIVVPAAAMIPVGFFAKSWLGISPWIAVLIGFMFIVFIALLGVSLSFKTMAVLFGGQMIILLIFAISSIIWAGNTGAFEVISASGVTSSGSLFGIAGIIVGSAAAVYSFIGFESSATMAEEVKSPTKDIPKAIVITAVLGTILLVFLAWTFVLSIPSRGIFSILQYTNPLPAMAGVIGRDVPPLYHGWQHVLSIGGIAAGVTAALAGVLAASRVLKKMSEEKVISGLFNKVTRKSGTPIAAILLVGSVGLFLGQFTPWETIVYAIAAGAVPTFIIVNFLSFWQCSSSEVTFLTVVTRKFLPVIGIAIGVWILYAGLPGRMIMFLIIWLVLGLMLVFGNAYLKPSVFSSDKEASKQEAPSFLNTVMGIFKPEKIRSKLVISTLLLVLSLVIVGVWWIYYAGSLAWWKVIAPYASGNFLASSVSLIVVVTFLVLMLLSEKFTSASDKKMEA